MRSRPSGCSGTVARNVASRSSKHYDERPAGSERITPLGGLIGYLRGCSALLVNYARRRALNLPVSSAGAESAVDYVIGQRLKRNGHMRWTREGANSLLQVRCAVLNGLDVRNFKRWYPPGKQFALLPRACLPS